jgi:serine/threonine protein kinase
MGLDYLHRVCKIIHTDLKPENVKLCLTEKEVKEIAQRGQLTTAKMYHQPPEIKALSSAAVLIDPKSFRGRGKSTTEDDKSKAAKRNEKK